MEEQVDQFVEAFCNGGIREMYELEEEWLHGEGGGRGHFVRAFNRLFAEFDWH